MKLKSTSILTALALGATVFLAHGQDANNNDPNRQRGGDRGGDRNRSPEEFRKMMAERMKAQLKVSDEEWSVIQPLVEKVTSRMRDVGGSRFGGGGPGRGPGGGPSGGTPPSSGGGDSGRSDRAGSAEREALRAALESEGTSPETLQEKLSAVRAVRAKASAELAAAREDLKKVLTVRQEALLVSYGLLE